MIEFNMTPEELIKSWEINSQHMDIRSWLKSIGFFIKHIIRDNNSLFRVIAEAVYNNQNLYETVKLQYLEFIKFIMENEKFNTIFNGPVEYLEKISDKTNGNLNDISVMNYLYRRDFVIIDFFNGPNFTFCKNMGQPIYLLYQKKIEHFDILLPVEYMKIFALCQSFSYKVLYENVFMMSDVENIAKKMLSNSFNENGDCNNEDSSHNKKYKKDGNKEILNNAIIPFPHKAAKGLSPYTYKNMEIDLWFEKKKENEFNSDYNGNFKLQVGVKCQCKIKPDQIEPYICYIQAMKLDGPCVVFIEELGEKRTVDFKQLKPLPFNETSLWCSNGKRGKMIKKLNLKKKKINNKLQDISNVVHTKNKVHFKTRVIENKLTTEYDLNNNSNINTGNEPCMTISKWKSVIKGEKTANFDCLKKYTAMDYITFKPYPVDYVAMPFTVEQNGNHGGNNTPRESQNSQNPPFSFTTTVSTTSSSPYVQYSNSMINGNSESNGVSSQYVSNSNTPVNNPTLNSLGSLVCSQNSYSPYPSLPIYCFSSMPAPSMRQPCPINYQYTPRCPIIPYGVNVNVSKSVHVNGSDLPYNDIPTLRFFFNLGIDWMQMYGMGWPSPPPSNAHPSTMHSNYYYAPNMTPNQLAMDMQNSLQIEDSPNNNRSPPEQSKNFGNNIQIVQKANGTKYTEFRGGRGGHSNRFRRNDNSDKNNTRNNNRGISLYNNNNGKKINNTRNGNNNIESAGTPNNQEKKETHEGELTPTNSPSLTPNMSFISYPPPSYYRYPLYSVEDGSVVQTGYPSSYNPYSSVSDENTSPALVDGYIPPPGAVPPYMAYIPPPMPSMYYSSPTNVSSYYSTQFQPNQSSSNESPTRN